MRQIMLFLLTVILMAGCKKETTQHGSGVDIYVLKSFTTTVDRSTAPATISITNAVPEDIPLIADQDILFYTQATTSFTLKKNIQPVINNYGPDKGFVVMVDNQPVYYGSFHPMYLSSIFFGVATITPFLFNNTDLKIDFPSIDGNSFLQQLDKRNDSRIINTFKVTNRLR